MTSIEGSGKISWRELPNDRLIESAQRILALSSEDRASVIAELRRRELNEALRRVDRQLSIGSALESRPAEAVRDYGTLRIFARAMAGIGWVVLGGAVLLGALAGVAAVRNLGVSLQTLFALGQAIGLGGAVGLLLGIGFIVSGQMISVLLDQRELLSRIAEAVERR